MTVSIRAYLSPTLVLLALDWAQGRSRSDFLGFAIRRVPGFRSADGRQREAQSWLPNRLTFDGPVTSGQPDAPSNTSPIQKFLWWDARIDEADRRAAFTYTVWPVIGSASAPSLLESARVEVKITLPEHIEDGIGTWFNRAVVSSQAFSRKVAAMGLDIHQTPPAEKALALRRWLANDMEQSFSFVLSNATKATSAIYHLTDKLWAIPALKAFAENQPAHSASVIYDAHEGRRKTPSPNQYAVDALGAKIDFHPRRASKIMHNKFVVTDAPELVGKPARLLTGSANFTTGGLTAQANLLHVIESPALAQIYNDRARMIASDPSLAATRKLASGWSAPIPVGHASIRASFSPEPKDRRAQIDTIVEAISHARHSVLFCLFSPTDELLRDACFAAGDRGLMMFGLVNAISRRSAQGVLGQSAHSREASSHSLKSMDLYHRSRKNRDVVDGKYFSENTVPEGFDVEVQVFPGEKRPPYAPVIVHHKFIVIDAEGKHPIVYSGSANMSNNSEHNNDENLLEIKDRRVAAIYLAEFLRLYEHYRARALAIEAKTQPHVRSALTLARDGHWADKYYADGSPEAKARVTLAQEPWD